MDIIDRKGRQSGDKLCRRGVVVVTCSTRAGDPIKTLEPLSHAAAVSHRSAYQRRHELRVDARDVINKYQKEKRRGGGGKKKKK